MLVQSRRSVNTYSVEVFGPIPEDADIETHTIVFGGEEAAITYARNVQDEAYGVRVSKRIFNAATGRLTAIRTIYRAGQVDQADPFGFKTYRRQ